jgi:hypothetical protein
LFIRGFKSKSTPERLVYTTERLGWISGKVWVATADLLELDAK